MKLLFRIDKSSVVYSDTTHQLLVSMPHDIARQNMDQNEGGGSSSLEELENGLDIQNNPIESALAESNAIIQQAHLEAESIKRVAWQEGYDAGRAEAESSFRQQFEAETEKIRGIVSRVNDEKERTLKSMEADIVNLALSIAEKITKVQLETSDNVYLQLIKDAIAEINSDGKITIRVSPLEYAKYFEDTSLDTYLGNTGLDVIVVKDEVLKSGALLLESDTEAVDAGVDSQLTAIKETFTGQNG